MARDLGNTSSMINGRCWHGCEAVLHDRASFDLVRLKNMILRFEKASSDLLVSWSR